MVDASVTTFERTFHVAAKDWGDTKEEQDNNNSVVLQDAINQGHRPTGPVKFLGAEEHGANKTSLALRYQVPVEPLRPEPWVALDIDEGPTITADPDDPMTQTIANIEPTTSDVEGGGTVDHDETSHDEEVAEKKKK